MKTFTDSTDEKWEISITAGTLKRAADLLGVDLGQPYAGEPPLMTRATTDLVFLVDLLWAICCPQAQARELTDVQFAERLGGEAIRAANDAFLDEWSLFFRSLNRPELVQAIDKMRTIQRREIELAADEIASKNFDERRDAEMAKQRRRGRLSPADLTPPGGPVASSPPSPAAGPTNTP